MCIFGFLKNFFNKRKESYTNIESPNFIYRWKTKYSFKKTPPPTSSDRSPIYTPGCLKRPIKYARNCMNCNGLFYKYENEIYCTKDCRFSAEYKNRSLSF